MFFQGGSSTEVSSDAETYVKEMELETLLASSFENYHSDSDPDYVVDINLYNKSQN